MKYASVVLLLLLPGILASCAPSVGAHESTTSPSPHESGAVAQVWKREAEYSRFAKAGDFDGYLSLWHDEFIGWPCGDSRPKRKSAIGGWVREVKQKGIDVTEHVIREGAQEFGNVVVVHYRVTEVDTYPDRRVERSEESKVTHTWMKVGDEWLIIGGMCGSLRDTAK
jgi:Domain of unknown function (DUF4440)